MGKNSQKANQLMKSIGNRKPPVDERCCECNKPAIKLIGGLYFCDKHYEKCKELSEYKDRPEDFETLLEKFDNNVESYEINLQKLKEFTDSGLIDMIRDGYFHDIKNTLDTNG